MSVAVVDIVWSVRRLLGDNPAEYVATADPGTATQGTTDTFTVTDGTEFAKGDVLEWQDDGELNLILSISTNTLSVTRGYQNSGIPTTSAAHAIGTRFVKRPAFQYVQILEAASKVIKGMWPYLYKLDGPTDLTPQTNGNRFYDLPITTIDLSQVVQLVGTTPTWQPFFYGERGNAYPVFIRNNMPNDFPDSTGDTGQVLEIPFLRDTTNHIWVSGIAKITDTITTAAYVDLTSGLMEDYVVEMVVSRLVAGSDAHRSTMADVTMADKTVAPRTRTTLAAYWANEAKNKRYQLEEELARTLPRMTKYGHRGPGEWRR